MNSWIKHSERDRMKQTNIDKDGWIDVLWNV